MSWNKTRFKGYSYVQEKKKWISSQSGEKKIKMEITLEKVDFYATPLRQKVFNLKEG